MMEPLCLIATGGTLDKDYHAIQGELGFSDSHLDELLHEANSTLDIQLQTLMLKDSLQMDDQDRYNIIQACLSTIHHRIVITHGTDTMVDTAKRIKETPELQHKTIILTGAMRPFKLGRSDASFNVGSALMAAQLLSNGVYIAMNGQLFEADDVIKNRQKGVFQNRS